MFYKIHTQGTVAATHPGHTVYAVVDKIRQVLGIAHHGNCQDVRPTQHDPNKTQLRNSGQTVCHRPGLVAALNFNPDVRQGGVGKAINIGNSGNTNELLFFHPFYSRTHRAFGHAQLGSDLAIADPCIAGQRCHNRLIHLVQATPGHEMAPSLADS